MLLRIGSKTDVGRQRDNNEDALGHIAIGALDVVLVCDGMGGHEGGETASALAVDTITRSFQRETSEAIAERIRQAVTAANAAVYTAAQSTNTLKGMGTTCVLLVTNKATNQAWIGHVGDSRCYRLAADGSFAQVTKDHSRVQEMVDAGWINKDEAAKSDVKNVITRAVGIDKTVAVDISGPHVLTNGDRYLLCSDGLTDMVTDDDLARILATCAAPQAAAERLVDIANEHGGFDNITVCVAGYGKRKPRLATSQPCLTRTQRVWRVARWVIITILIAILTVLAVHKQIPIRLPNWLKNACDHALFRESASKPGVAAPAPVLVPGAQVIHTNALATKAISIYPIILPFL
jgi:protein phosphatase